MTFKVGKLEAKQGEKKIGYLNIINTELNIPCTLINGISEGKTIAITGGIHGGEYLGIETAIRLAYNLKPQQISGKIIILHPSNLPAFLSKLQDIGPYDGKNLGTEFPGKATGTITQKIAYTITKELHTQSDFYIDLRGGDIHESLKPYVLFSEVGTDEVNKISKEAASLMGIKYICESTSMKNTIGSAALKGVSGLLGEVGQLGLWSEVEVCQYVAGVENVLKYLKVINGQVEKLCKVDYISKMYVIKSEHAGCWYSNVTIGHNVQKNERIGEIKDYFGNILGEYFSPTDGLIFCTASSLAINSGETIVAISSKPIHYSN